MPQHDSSGRPPGQKDADPFRILLVEDNALIAMHFETDLEEAGFDIVGPADNRAEALSLVAAQPCQLAFVDIDLTDGRTGGQLATELHAHHDCLVVLASGQEEIAAEWAHAAIGFLEKPIDTKAMIRVAELIAAGHRAADADWPASLHWFGHTGGKIAEDG